MRSNDLFVFLILISFVLLFPAVLLRYKKEQLRHQERMAALEKGAELPAFPAESGPWTPRVYLLRGLIWLFGGIGLTIFLVGLSLTANRVESIESRLWHTQDLRQRGVPEEQLKKFEDSPREQQGMPMGFALIGLIPIGVGLAYILFYQGERKPHLTTAA